MSEILTRKPLLKPRPSGKFVMHDFQEEDISRLLEEGNSANWSEMGAMKTTTAEWLLEQKIKHIPNPRVLIITTKTGKGAYYESMSEVLPEWTVFTMDTKRARLVNGSRVIPLDVDLPDPLYMRPVAVLAHYHCFTNRACIPQQVKQKMIGKDGKTVETLPVINEDGTFEMRIPFCTRLLQMHWDAIVLDEAHRVKNFDAQWTRNIKKLKAPFKHIMSGTGFVNNPAEIWSLLDFLYSGSPTSPHAKIVNSTGYWKFREYFCKEDDYSGYRKVTGIKHDKEPEFRDLVRKVGVRRTMLECFPNIKEPIETAITVELNPVQKKMYDEIMKNLWTLDQAGTPLHSPNVLSMLNRLRQIAVATPEVTGDRYDEILERRVFDVKLIEPSSKLDAAMETIQGLEWDSERKDQVVVFSNFRDPLALLATRLTKAGIPFLHLDASMNDKQRYELWHEQWPKAEHQVFLCTLGVGSESINLSAAHRAIFLDQSWSPAQNKQAIGRVYRPGQTGAVQLIYIRAEGTVDFRVLDTVEEKHGWFTSIFGSWNETEVADESE